jgi:diacylglycerol kinase
MNRWIFRVVCALRGLGHTLMREPAGRVHGVCAVAVAALGLALRVSAVEWAILSLSTALVIGAEAMNSAVERLADRVSTEREETIRILKDTAAGAVLVTSLGAAGAALAIFGPKLLTIFR